MITQISSAPVFPVIQQQSVVKTTNANNTTANVPLFRVTGIVRILKLYGVVTTVLGATHTLAFFRLNDQTAQPAITLAVGPTLSAAAVGTIIGKLGLAAAALTASTAAAGRVVEPTTLETLAFSEFLVVAKGGANTDIEYSYATLDAPTSGAIQFFVEYQAISANGALVAQ